MSKLKWQMIKEIPLYSVALNRVPFPLRIKCVPQMAFCCLKGSPFLLD